MKYTVLMVTYKGKPWYLVVKPDEWDKDSTPALVPVKLSVYVPIVGNPVGGFLNYDDAADMAARMNGEQRVRGVEERPSMQIVSTINEELPVQMMPEAGEGLKEISHQYFGHQYLMKRRAARYRHKLRGKLHRNTVITFRFDECGHCSCYERDYGSGKCCICDQRKGDNG